MTQQEPGEQMVKRRHLILLPLAAGRSLNPLAVAVAEHTQLRQA